MHLVRSPSAQALLDVAAPLLRANEAEDHLVLGILGGMVRNPHRVRTTPYLAAVAGEGANRDEGPTMVAVMAPPHHLVLTRAPHEAIIAVADDLDAEGWKPPGVHGPRETADEFAELWCTRHGLQRRRRMEMRSHMLTAVVAPRWATGMPRRARADEIELLVHWFACFRAEAEGHGGVEDTRELVMNHVENDAIHLWDDGRPVSMAIETGATPNGIRIGGVYTPKELRNRGYASSCVAALSQQLLDRGRQFVFLYTDVANPTSNAIYARIGYRPVADMREWSFDRKGSGS